MKDENKTKRQLIDELMNLRKQKTELKRSGAKLNRVEEALQESKKELAIRNSITQIFMTFPDDQMYGEVLQVVLEALKSSYGIFGYINEDGALVCPSMTRDIFDKCQVPDKEILFPRETWSGIWGRALIEKKGLYSNGPFHVPRGHIPIQRALAVPIIHQEVVMGLLQLANKATDYGEKDRDLLEGIAGLIAPILHARLNRNREERERRMAEEALQKRTHELDERVKELNCLYGISKLREEPGISFDDTIQGILDLIPPAWQFPEITCARAVVNDRIFSTKNFNETFWKQRSDIMVSEEQIGALEVCYLEDKTEGDGEPFFEEEKSLINAIAERLGRVVERKRAEEALQKPTTS